MKGPQIGVKLSSRQMGLGLRSLLRSTRRWWGVLNKLTRPWRGFLLQTRRPYMQAGPPAARRGPGRRARGGYCFCHCQWDGWGGKHRKRQSLWHLSLLLTPEHITHTHTVNICCPQHLKHTCRRNQIRADDDDWIRCVTPSPGSAHVCGTKVWILHKGAKGRLHTEPEAGEWWIWWINHPRCLIRTSVTQLEGRRGGGELQALYNHI